MLNRLGGGTYVDLNIAFSMYVDSKMQNVDDIHCQPLSRSSQICENKQSVRLAKTVNIWAGATWDKSRHQEI